MSARGVVDEGMRAYYEQRAAEYDDWWLGRGIFAKRERPGWDEEVAAVLDAALAPGGAPEEWQERKLNDGSRHRVDKRFFTAEGLLDELGGGRVLHAGDWFVMVAAPR